MGNTEQQSDNYSATKSSSFTKEDEAVVNLLKTVDYINQISSEIIDPFGITSQQYNILRILRGAETKGLPTLELADRMLVRSPGVTRLIDRIEKKQLVKRERSAEDRRVVLCQITKKGRNLLDKMDDPIKDMNNTIVKNLNNDQLEELIKLLKKLRE